MEFGDGTIQTVRPTHSRLGADDGDPNESRIKAFRNDDRAKYARERRTIHGSQDFRRKGSSQTRDSENPRTRVAKIGTNDLDHGISLYI
jgi:hypothetical protein